MKIRCGGYWNESTNEKMGCGKLMQDGPEPDNHCSTGVCESCLFYWKRSLKACA